jgi:uncharacterized protein (DUF362 family)
MDTVVLLKCKKNFEETLYEALELIGGFDGLRSPFILKPNICTGNDHTGCANVKLEVVEALVNLILQEKKDTAIKIVESDSMSKYADKAYERYGFKTYVEKTQSQGANISLINLTNTKLTKFQYDGYYFKDPELPFVLKDSGYIASVALAKTHSLTMITGALKNLFGLLPRKDQAFYHPDIHEVILDLNRMFRSNLCLIDGRIGLEGVISGNPRPLGCIILGKNPVSVDSTLARLMGFNPERIRHIVEAEKHGLGCINPKIVGDELESQMVKFSEPSSLKTNALLEKR